MKIRSIRALLFAFICTFSIPVLAQPVDLNKASATELAEGLNGIGQAKAEAIVAYRQTHGPFTSLDQLSEVKGIGPATVKKNLDNMTISPAKPKQSKSVAKK